MYLYMRKGVFKKTISGDEAYLANQKQLLQSQGWSETDTEISTFLNQFIGGETDHAHANKALLDTYNQSNADIADAVSKKHSNSLDHANTNDPSADQKTALSGTSGTPSSTNKYVTNDDSRMSDARTPTAHSHNLADLTEKSYNSLADKPSTMPPSSHNNSAHSETYITVSSVTDANLSTSDVATNDVSTSKHGFCPKAPNDTSKFLRGDGTWNIPTTQVMHCQHQKTAPSDGGSSVAGLQTRVLNTVVLNEISGASLSSNQITLPAGTYEVYAYCPTYAVGATQAGIYNETDSAWLLMGTNSYDIAGAFVQGKFTLAAQKVITLRQYCESAQSGNGLGVSANSGMGKEVYANIMVWKV